MLSFSARSIDAALLRSSQCRSVMSRLLQATSSSPRTKISRQFSVLLFALLAMAVNEGGAWSIREVRGQEVDYQRDVRPLLSDRCFSCHGPDEQTREADLRLDRPESWEDRGAIVSGDRHASEVWRRITSTDPDLQMPPPESNKRLDAEQIERLGVWIDQGARFESHWAYRPLTRPALPTEFPQETRPIDRFVRQAQQARGLAPSARADDATLLRRVTLDLTGLPPSIDQVDAYLADTTPDKYERWVDQLLQSDSYGENLAIFWLDLVRYADTVGYHGDQDHLIGPYRDWVINSFNSDLPFDQFSELQLAGDLIAPDDPRALIATGYLRVLQTSHEGGIQKAEYQVKYAADRVRNFGDVWLGSSIGCAECHDHKYDPFTQDDFYGLSAFFADVDDSGSFRGTDSIPTRREPELDVRSPLDERRVARLEAQVASYEQRLTHLESSTLDPSGEQELAALNQALAVARADLIRLRERMFRTMIVRSVEPRTIRILPRGNWQDESGAIVLPHVPRSLGEIDATDSRATRADLAHWLFEQNQGLTARVLANRLWARFFGAGLSRQLADHGAQGEAPSHPELLEWLASELVDHEWHLKPWIRELVLSETYCQASVEASSATQIDASNPWLTRQRRIRLPAEIIRDQALAFSGLLVDEPGGAACRPYQPSGYYARLNFPPRAYYADEGPSQYRRGVYVHWQRQFLHPMLRAFDAPTREECTAMRSVSNTPTAALTLLNDPTFVEAARVAAGQVLREVDSTNLDDPAVLRSMLITLWRRLLVRQPSDQELATLEELYRDFLNESRTEQAPDFSILAVGHAPVDERLEPHTWLALTMVARAVLNLDETVTRP